MFVTSAGTSVRPPVQWTANLYRIIYSYPYIIGLSPESVMIYSISDQRLKQAVLCIQILRITGSRALYPDP